MVKTTLLRTVLVVACAVMGAGCTGPLSLDGRSCPCAEGYVCCDLTRQCLRPGVMCAKFAITVDHELVRQGGDVKLTITGPELSELSKIQLGDIQVPGTFLPRHGAFEVPIKIPHGARLGPADLQFTDRGRSEPYPSAALVAVSPIVVALGGDDHGLGTTKDPFRTLERVGDALGEGDTLQLAAGMESIGRQDGGPISFPNKVTVQGEPLIDVSLRASQALTQLRGQIWPAKDLVIRELSLNARVMVAAKGSVVKLENVQAVGPDVGIQVQPEAVGADISITGWLSNITSTFQTPVKINASDVHLKIEDVEEISNLDQFGALTLGGNDIDVEIVRSAISAASDNAIFGFMRARLHLVQSVIHGIVNLQGPETVADVKATTFNMASLTRADGGLRFWGDKLTLTDSMFHLVGLVQGTSESQVVVRNTTFDGYREPAITLEAGDLDLGNAVEPGENKFDTTMSGSGPDPVAVSVRAKTGTATVTVSMTRINGRMPPAGMVMGPAREAPYYQIENMVPIQLY